MTLDVLIAGGGRVGFQTAALLADRGHDVTVIERDQPVVDDIADEWTATVLSGDATDPTILKQADLDSVDVVAGLTGDTGVNLAVCLAAEEFAPGIRTVARIERLEGESYLELVDAVLFPEYAGAHVAADEITGSSVESLDGTLGGFDVLYVRVEEDAPAAGRTLSELGLPDGALVVSAAGGNSVARADTTFTPGEQYVVAVESDAVEETLALLRGDHPGA